MREFVKLYFKDKDKVIEKNIDVNDVSHYLGMGWSFEKPSEQNEKEIQKEIQKKEEKKEEKQNVQNQN